MPYIDQGSRSALDQKIDALATEIKCLVKKNPTQPLLDHAGVINYVATSLALKLIAPYKSYWAIALMSGVFHNIGAEFYRKYAVPYEDQKIAENGDVYPPA